MTLHHGAEPVIVEGFWIEAGYDLCLACELTDCTNSAPTTNPKCKRYGLRTGCVGRGLTSSAKAEISLPDVLTPGPGRHHTYCERCLNLAWCKKDVADGLPCLCEATASVLVGGVLVTL